MRCCSVFHVVLAVCAVTPVVAAPAYVRIEQQGSRWLVGNDFVERIVSFSEENGLRTESLIRKSSGTDFTAYGRQRNQFGPEFSFSANGDRLDGHKSFRFANAQTNPVNGGQALRIVLHDRKNLLDVTVYYAVFDRYPAVRKWIAITNKSASAITLTQPVLRGAEPGRRIARRIGTLGRLRRDTASIIFHGARFRCGNVPAKFEDRRRRGYCQRGARISEAHGSGPGMAGRPESDVRYGSLSV